jgi:hypothetical protein
VDTATPAGPMTGTEAPVTGPAAPSSRVARRLAAFHFRHGTHTLPWTARHHSEQPDLNSPVGTYHSFARSGGRFIPLADTESVIPQVAIREWRADRLERVGSEPVRSSFRWAPEPGRAGTGTQHGRRSAGGRRSEGAEERRPLGPGEDQDRVTGTL